MKKLVVLISVLLVLFGCGGDDVDVATDGRVYQFCDLNNYYENNYYQNYLFNIVCISKKPNTYDDFYL